MPLLADAGFWPIHVDNTFAGVVLFLILGLALGAVLEWGRRIASKFP
jgi:hypothetical protein